MLQWTAFAVGIPAWALVLQQMSVRFGYESQVIDMPILPLVAVLLSCGLACGVGLPGLLRDTEREGLAFERIIFPIIVVVGLMARLILCASEPILEDDYQRYLWDGAVVANGTSPYRYSPAALIEAGVNGPLGALSQTAATVLDRIGHPQLTTLYPPGTQAMFAVAHWIEPFSLRAWRGLILGFDLATLAVLVALLHASGRSVLWVAVYWWNPVVIKELFNSAHMDGLALPFVLGALLIAANRPRLATCAIGIAFSFKFWPVILLPLIWRAAWGQWRVLAGYALLMVPFVAISVWPLLAAGLNQDAGVVAYATSWSRNSALYPALEVRIAALLELTPVGSGYAARVTRSVIMVAMTLITLAISWTPVGSRADLMTRATWLVGALVLLSPAQYPWYTVWLAPLLALHPISGFLVLPAVLPLYELYFYYAARDATQVFTGVIVWLIWIPVWALLLWDGRPHVRRVLGMRTITIS